MLSILVKILITIACADLLTGIVHWWEDSYGNPQWKYLGQSIIMPNLVHHKKPREFLKGNYFQRINTSFAAGLVLLFLCYLLSALNWYTLLWIAISIQGNEVHRMAHRTDRENGKFICMLQKTGILQSRRHHGHHHSAPYECSYCALTNYVNPLLDSINFWTKLEWLIEKLTGIKVLRGSAVRNGL